MRNNGNMPTVTIEAHGSKIKIIRVGKTPKLKSVDTVNSNEIRAIHSHFTYEVFFVSEGTLEIVTDETVKIYERKVIIIPPKKGHYTIPSGGGSFCLLMTVADSKKAQLLKWIVYK